MWRGHEFTSREWARIQRACKKAKHPSSPVRPYDVVIEWIATEEEGGMQWRQRLRPIYITWGD